MSTNITVILPIHEIQSNLENYLKKISIKKGKFIYNKITGRRIYAIIPVHVYGHIINMQRLPFRLFPRKCYIDKQTVII